MKCFSLLGRWIAAAWALAALANGVASAQSSAEPERVIHAGAMVDVVAGTVRQQVTLVIRGDRIAAVEAGYRPAGPGQTVIDLKDKTLLPGLMDMHTHHSGELGPGSYNESFRMNPADYAFRAVGYAEKTLMAGFTTVREVGDRHNLSISLRNAINKGWIPGPRMLTAGRSLATTGGHADQSNGLNDLLKGDPGPKEGVVNGPYEAAKAVRQRYKDGADLIKITITGGVLSEAKSGDNPQFTDDEVRAVVETANDYGMMVAAHAHGAAGMKRAIRAGVTTIEHGTFMDDEAIALMKEKGAYLVPTLLAGKWVTLMADKPGVLPEVVRPKARRIGAHMLDNFGKLYQSGVKIAFGTDSGVSPHGMNAVEFELMVNAGMPALAAIRSATTVTAELLGMERDLGSLEPGKLADVIAVEANPLDDVKTLQNVVFVMKEGVVYKQ